MKITIITLFPEMFEPVLNSSILKRAQQKGIVQYELINLRDFGQGVHKIVDDRPFGGGAGMVLKADVLAKALLSVYSFQLSDKQSFPTNQILPVVGQSVSETDNPTDKPKTDQPQSENRKLKTDNCKVLLTSASGKPYNQQTARRLSKEEHLVIVCGHYEGVDQRFIDRYVDEEISIGDYVLTGGEVPAMVIADSVTRLLPGVLEKEGATENESHENGLLEYPHYTRPEEFEGLTVPEVLRSGNHAKIGEWREEHSIAKTKKVRPDLLNNKS